MRDLYPNREVLTEVTAGQEGVTHKKADRHTISRPPEHRSADATAVKLILAEGSIGACYTAWANNVGNADYSPLAGGEVPIRPGAAVAPGRRAGRL